MTSKTFVSGTTIDSAWLNDVNTVVYRLLLLPVYANNAAAISGGLTAGMNYRTGGDPDLVCVVH